MKGHTTTTLTTELSLRKEAADVDGIALVMVFSSTQPSFAARVLGADLVTIGRKAETGICLPLDSRMSRQHATVRLDGERLELVDLDSHNGTFVDGAPIKELKSLGVPRTLRVGDTVFIFVSQGGPYLNASVEVRNGAVVGPILAQAHDRIGKIAALDGNVLLTGATGVGKEIAARHFHAASRAPGGPFVALNCATIPPAIAERILFGAQRGAYSGAEANAEGYVQAADGGTLFLDEVAELDLTVQAKLLRVLETKEVVPLGGVRPRQVDFRLCAATLKDLRSEIAAGRFREDLYHRIGRPEVRIPTLRERPEEIPHLAARMLSRLDPRLTPSASFIEVCLLRDWPGNVREFAREMQDAAMSALDQSRFVLTAADLPPLDTEARPPTSTDATRSTGRDQPPRDDEVLEVLRAEKGNVSSASRRLGMHRNQLRRWLALKGLDAADYRKQTDP